MTNAPSRPHHIAASEADLAGNDGVGRYVLLPGSPGRARAIAERFENARVRAHPRGHDFHLGTVRAAGRVVDLAAVASGMGCPSLDIIVNELVGLGARRLLRVGTAGSLQPGRVRAGELVVATGAVRDEHTSRAYIPVEVPALASLELLEAARRAAPACGVAVHFGPVHSKDSLWARELGAGPRAPENARYMQQLAAAGVLASEMESAHLFVLAALADQRLRGAGQGPPSRCLAGAVLAVVGETAAFGDEEVADRAVERSIDLALAIVGELAASELGPSPI